MKAPKTQALNGLLKTGAATLVLLSVLVAALSVFGIAMNLVDTTDYAIDELERGGYSDYITLEVSALEAMAARLLAGTGYALGLAILTGYVARRFIPAGEPWAIGLVAAAWGVTYPFAFAYPLLVKFTAVTAGWAAATAALLVVGLGLSWLGLRRAQAAGDAPTGDATPQAGASR